MLGFEPQASGDGSECLYNCATTLALTRLTFFHLTFVAENVVVVVVVVIVVAVAVIIVAVVDVVVVVVDVDSDAIQTKNHRSRKRQI